MGKPKEDGVYKRKNALIIGTLTNILQKLNAVTKTVAALPSGKRRGVLVSFLAVLSLAQYSYTIRNPLIWDAKIAVTEDPSIRSLRNIPSFFTSEALPAKEYE